MSLVDPTLEQLRQHPSARFTLSPVFPLDKDFLRHIQAVAYTDERSLQVWAEHFDQNLAEEAIFFRAKEWGDANIAAHRVDLYTIQRGLLKVFDAKYDLGIATRQAILKALFEQQARPSIFSVCPRLSSEIIQLALFDQVVY